LESNLRAYSDRNVLYRYGNIKAANPEMATNALILANQFIEKTGKKITDEQFKALLYDLSPKRSIKITRK